MTSNDIANTRNKLAFVGAFCYFSRNIIDEYIFVMRDLRDFRKGFVAATAAGAAMVMPLSATHAQDAPKIVPVEYETTMEMRETFKCADLRENEAGRVFNAGTSAWVYSDEQSGRVGISIYPGRDLGDHSPEKLGTILVNTFRDNGVQAECFVNDEGVENGTSIDFKVNGLSWGKTRTFNISEATDPETLKGVIDEAKTGRMLLSSNSTADRPDASF